ncbi:MAG: hypothetical protein KAH57_11240 [Thermoplasmata archaeon]|nr:hypothetical protein [Thermoplasmata archaeon]
MGSEPIKNEDNKVMAILGWLGILGAIILIVTKKKDEDKQMATIFWQSLIWGIGLFLAFIPVLGWIIYIVCMIMLLVGFVMAITGKVWISPLVGGFAVKKANGE